MCLAGCSARSPQNELARTIKDVRSWAAGACFVADRWRQRAVPTHYALDALEDAGKDLREQVTEIGKQHDIEPAAKQEAQQAAERVLALSKELRQSIEHQDGGRAATACREMSAVRSRLTRMTQQEAAK